MAWLTFLEGFIKFAFSKVGLVLIASLMSYWWGSSSATNECEQEKVVVQAKAIKVLQDELIREQEASRSIAREATKRVEDDLKVNLDQLAITEQLRQSESNNHEEVKPAKEIKVPSCVVDGEYAGIVRKLDAAHSRASHSSRRAK